MCKNTYLRNSSADSKYMQNYNPPTPLVLRGISLSPP